MGALLSMGRSLFFRCWRIAAGKGETGSRPSPALRSLEQRQMAMAKPLSRPKPPEAGAEGQPLQGFGHRLASPAELGAAPTHLRPLLSSCVALRSTRGDPFSLFLTPAAPRT